MPAELQCPKTDEVASAILVDSAGECIRLGGSGKQNLDMEVLDKRSSNGLAIHIGGGEFCDDHRDYSLSVNIECGSEMTEAIISEDVSYCFKYISFAHPSGCKVGHLSPLW